jgi:hypothetical protein
MKAKRLHRKRTLEKADQLHEAAYDPFADFEGSPYELMVAKFFYRLRDNIRTVILLIGAALIAPFGFVVYDIIQTSREEKALLAYEELLKNPVMSAPADPSASLRKLDEYMEVHTTQKARLRALMHKHSILEKADRKKEAAEVAAQLAEKVESPSLKVFFFTRASILYEGAGEPGSSLAASEKALALTTDEGEIRATLLFLQARGLRAMGKESAMRQVIETLMKMDEKSHPEVIPIKQAALVYLLDESAAGK